jgi:hypothetical protein
VKDASARKVPVKHRSNPARRLIRNALIASTPAAVLTAGGSLRPVFAHGLGLGKNHVKHAHQSERVERRSFRDTLAAAASRSYQHSPRSGLLDFFGIASVYGVQRTASGADELRGHDGCASHTAIWHESDRCQSAQRPLCDCADQRSRSFCARAGNRSQPRRRACPGCKRVGAGFLNCRDPAQ